MSRKYGRKNRADRRRDQNLGINLPSQSAESVPPILWQTRAVKGPNGSRHVKNAEVALRINADSHVNNTKRLAIRFYNNANKFVRGHVYVCFSEINKDSNRLYMMFADADANRSVYKFYTLSKASDNICLTQVSIPADMLDIFEEWTGDYPTLKFDKVNEAYYIEKGDKQ